MRVRAAEALGDLGNLRAVEPLIAALRDAHPRVRQFCAEALGTLGDVRAIDPLIDMLEDKSANVRGSASISLGQLGGVRALPRLEAIAQSDEAVTWHGRSVKDIAMSAVRQIKGQDH